MQERLTNRYWQGEYQKLYPQTLIDSLKCAVPLTKIADKGRNLSGMLDEAIPEIYTVVKKKRDFLSKNSIKYRPLFLYRGLKAEYWTGINKWQLKIKKNVDNILKNGVRSKNMDPVVKMLKKKEDYIIPDRSHFGDQQQAREYVKTQTGDEMCLLKYTLKPGVENILFKPKLMSLVSTKKRPWAAHYLRAIGTKKKWERYVNANANEGTCRGYIGLKPEKRGDFSISIGTGNSSRLLFQYMVDHVRRVAL